MTAPQATVAARWLRRVARQGLDFREFVESRRWRNPETGNDVKFVSLPRREQARIFGEWRARQRGESSRPERERGLVPVDRERARDTADKLADTLARWPGRDDDKVETLGRMQVRNLSVTDVRGETHRFPLHVSVGEARPGQWTSGRRFVRGGHVSFRHEGEQDRGRPFGMEITLDGDRTLGQLRKQRDRVADEIYSVLVHEMTHARDVMETPAGRERREEGQEEGHAYYNRPSEVRAFKRQVAEEVLGEMRHLYEDEDEPEWIGSTGEMVAYYLGKSPTWERVRRFLTPENRRKFLESAASVVRKFKEERGGRVASARTGAYSDDFLQWARSTEHRNPGTGNRVKFDSLPPAEQARIHERWRGSAGAGDPGLADTGEETWQGGKIYRADVRRDAFVHFTPRSRARQILESGKLLSEPPHEKMGIAGVQAVSLGYGESVPAVQTTHIRESDADPTVAVVFRTRTTPSHGHSEEVVWDGDVDLADARIVGADEATDMLRRAPRKISEDDMVVYGRREKAASPGHVADGWLRRAVTRKRVDEVLRAVEGKDLPFEHLFGDRTRLVVDAPEAQTKFRDAPAVRAMLDRLGLRGAQMDFDDGTVSYTQETRDGPKERTQKMTKVLARGAARARADAVETGVRGGLSEKEARRVLAADERARKLQARRMRLGAKVGTELPGRLAQQYPALRRVAEPPTEWATAHHGTPRAPKKLAEKWHEMADPQAWIRKGEEQLERATSRTAKLREELPQVERAGKVKREIAALPDPVRVMNYQAATQQAREVLRGMSEEDISRMAKEATGDDPGAARYIEETLTSFRDRNTHVGRRVWEDLMRAPSYEGRPAMRRFLGETLRGLDKLPDDETRKALRIRLRGIMHGGKSDDDIVATTARTAERLGQLREEQKKLPDPDKIHGLHTDAIHLLYGMRGEEEALDNMMDAIHTRLREEEGYDHPDAGDVFDDWLDTDAGIAAVSDQLAERTGLGLDDMQDILAEQDVHLDALKREIADFREAAKDIDDDQVSGWKRAIDERLSEIADVAQEEEKEFAFAREHGDKKVPRMRHALGLVAKADELRRQYDRFAARPPMKMLISRDPIDVLRMSDHPHGRAAIESCHSEGGSYFHCAIQEAEEGGAVAYLVSADDAEKIDTEAPEVFEDRTRGVEGIKPFARVRLHRFTTPEGDDVAIPAARVYGLQAPGLADAALRWSREQQRDVFDRVDPAKLKIHGGTYLDMPAKNMVARFFKDRPEPEQKPAEQKPAEQKQPEQKPAERQQPQQLQLPLEPAAAPPGAFWEWMGRTYREVPNPNPNGRQNTVSPSTLKEYSEGGEHEQRAKQIVQQYVRQYQQAQQQRVAAAWMRTAVYSPDFIKAVSGRRFRNPETGNEVKFLSLPDAEQKRIHDQWATRGRAPATLEPHLREGRYDDVKLQLRARGADADWAHRVMGTGGDERKFREKVLDLAGMGALGSLVESADVTVADKESGYGTELRVMGRGKDGLHFDRILHFDEHDFPDYVRNEHFSVAPGAPEGVATRMLATQVSAAREAGFKEISTYAAGQGPAYGAEIADEHPEGDEPPEDDPMQGYYVWPRLGFDAEIGGEMPWLWDRMPEDVEGRVEEIADELGEEPKFSHLMMFPEGRDWWRDWGESVDVNFPLQEGSPDYDPTSDRVLQAYVAEKARLAGRDAGDWASRIGALLTEDDEKILDRIWAQVYAEKKAMRNRDDSSRRVASIWIRRLITAKYSPEFYRTVVKQRFRHPETGNLVMFHSLPQDAQKKVHDQWAAARAPHKTQVSRGEWGRIMDKALEDSRRVDEAEAERRREERREMARAVTELKQRGAPQRIIDKERRRLIREMHQRQLARQREKAEETAREESAA